VILPAGAARSPRTRRLPGPPSQPG
jgi:hypothetical protein